MRVLLADDHPLFLDGLKNLILSRGQEVVGTAQDGQEALEKARERFEKDLSPGNIDEQKGHPASAPATRASASAIAPASRISWRTVLTVRTMSPTGAEYTITAATRCA